MTKVKVSKGVASLILIACLFAGWQTLLVVSVLLLAFCDVEDYKDVIIRVVTFYVGLTLFSILWGLLVDGYDLFYSGVNDLIKIINSYLDKPIEIYKLYQYLLDPIKTIIGFLDKAVTLLITLAKFGFILSLFENKTMKENIVTKKINEFVTKAVNYVEGSEK